MQGLGGGGRHLRHLTCGQEEKLRHLAVMAARRESGGQLQIIDEGGAYAQSEGRFHGIGNATLGAGPGDGPGLDARLLEGFLG